MPRLRAKAADAPSLEGGTGYDWSRTRKILLKSPSFGQVWSNPIWQMYIEKNVEHRWTCATLVILEHWISRFSASWSKTANMIQMGRGWVGLIQRSDSDHQDPLCPVVSTARRRGTYFSQRTAWHQIFCSTCGSADFMQLPLCSVFCFAKMSGSHRQDDSLWMQVWLLVLGGDVVPCRTKGLEYYREFLFWIHFLTVLSGYVAAGQPLLRYIIMTDEHPCCPDAHKMETPSLFGTLWWSVDCRSCSFLVRHWSCMACRKIGWDNGTMLAVRKILAGRIRQRPLQVEILDCTGWFGWNSAARMLAWIMMLVSFWWVCLLLDWSEQIAAELHYCACKKFPVFWVSRQLAQRVGLHHVEILFYLEWVSEPVAQRSGKKSLCTMLGQTLSNCSFEQLVNVSASFTSARRTVIPTLRNGCSGGFAKQMVGRCERSTTSKSQPHLGYQHRKPSIQHQQQGKESRISPDARCLGDSCAFTFDIMFQHAKMLSTWLSGTISSLECNLLGWHKLLYLSETVATSHRRSQDDWPPFDTTRSLSEPLGAPRGWGAGFWSAVQSCQGSHPCGASFRGPVL